MKQLIILLFPFVTTSCSGQTWTVTRLRDSVLEINKRIADIQYRLSLKNINDDIRNARIKRLEERLDSAYVYLNMADFEMDSASKIISIKYKPDTFVIIKKAPRIPNPTVDTNIGGIGLNPIGKLPSGDMPYTLIIPATTQTKEQQLQQDISDLKWQRDYIEELLDDDTKLINKLQKKINEQQKIIEKLKR